jgi:glucose-6-phosphate 1-dehydrogenase
MPPVIVIFGATGDLTARKLIPALFRNHRKGRLPDGTRIIGFSRSPQSDDAFRARAREALGTVGGTSATAQEWDAFSRCLEYQAGDFTDPAGFAALARRITGGGTASGPWLFYLATAPDLFPAVIARLHGAGLTDGSPAQRIVIEKPFGRDRASAGRLNTALHALVPEDRIYRIDHYLGKETVQNLLVLRFANAIFEPLWNRNYVDHVQITVAETVGVESRAGYYDTSGALRDMFQNHLLQLLTLVAMEPPSVYDADALRNEKVKVLSALREIPPELSARHTVRGQYSGYRQERGVAPESQTETYAALRCLVDNWRWQGVPFYLRSGKRLRERASEIIMQFRRPPTQILDTHAGRTDLFTNRLSICIQPDEGMHLRFVTKVPDGGLQTRPVDMDFHFRDTFGDDALPEAYERLLLDALHGDASLFARSDEIERAWGFIDGVREGWEGGTPAPLVQYEPGSWGPAEADLLPGREGRWWVHDCAPHASASGADRR